ncbi:MAG: DUF1552 domain-containing protein [Verrucomicrobiaceae bacterium]
MSEFSRRGFLRGAGALIGLPALESLGFKTFAATKPVAPALRMGFLYIPNGVNVHEWAVTGEGNNYVLSNTLSALQPFKNDFSVISNLAHATGRAKDDGAGDHARATATFLTGCRAKKTAGSDIRLGQSVDQVAADQIGHQTRLASLELSTDGQRSSGNCDSGYSCAYQFNLSWKTETMPMAPEQDPRLVFERLFGSSNEGSDAAAARRKRYEKSILDFVLDDAKSLQRQVSGADNRKIEEYLSSVRDIETRIEKTEKMQKQLPPGTRCPSGIPPSTQEHIRAMFDLLLLAFQTDSTRIATYMLAHDGSNRNFPEIGVADAHHGLSHHQNNPEKLAKIAKIDKFYIEQLAWFLKRMKDTKEDEGSLLDHSMIVYGGGLSDGNQHSHDHLPVLLAGGGNGTLHPGQHVNLPGETPMTNLYLAMLERMGVHAERVGDSTGVLAGI